MLNKLYHHPLIRYLAIASGIVVVELIVFQLIEDWVHNYVIATALSFALAVVVNWFLSRKVVFGASKRHPAKEFMYVALASIVGLGIQLFIVYLCVQFVHLFPLIGKILSIFGSFFWNYWCRAHLIFGDKAPASTEEKVERIDEAIY